MLSTGREDQSLNTALGGEYSIHRSLPLVGKRKNIVAARSGRNENRYLARRYLGLAPRGVNTLLLFPKSTYTADWSRS